MIRDMIMIACVVTFGIDCTDFMESIKGALGRWLKVRPENITLKPFDCSLCSTWWACLLYCAIAGHFTLEGVFCLALEIVETSYPVISAMSLSTSGLRVIVSPVMKNSCCLIMMAFMML